MSVPDTVRHDSSAVVFDSYPLLGFNYRMTDIQAAVGREQLKRLPELIALRRRLAERYRSLLQDIPGLALPFEPDWARSNWQSYCVRLPAGANQRRIMQMMLDVGVATRRGIMCAHRESSYEDIPPRHPLPESESAQDHCILLPLYAQLGEDDQADVARALRHACLAAPRDAFSSDAAPCDSTA
jgi:dTDP-4-amino-4,6-dideoxygalactose transaminase